MLVRLKNPWFSPTNPVQRDKIQSVSGHRYKKGVHEMPDSLRAILPKGAEILNEMPEEVVEVPSDDLKDYDEIRKGDDKLIEKLEEAEIEANKLKKVRQENMARARAAKLAKKDK